ncbi:MAG: nuclear transport factor 2 family protein [Bacteroidota bacterium]
MRFILTLIIIFIINQFMISQNRMPVLDTLIDYWHLQAAKANFDGYFNITSDNFVFLGTAPGERWNKKEFMNFSKPYFDKGKAWDFSSKNRNWIFSDDQEIAWFDEDLDTWMNTCRGSGICIKNNGQWKLSYYNLTVLIENEKIDDFIQLRKN